MSYFYLWILPVTYIAFLAFSVWESDRDKAQAIRDKRQVCMKLAKDIWEYQECVDGKIAKP